MTAHDASAHERLRQQLTPYLRALWGGDFQLRFAQGTPQLRSAFAGREQVLPALRADDSPSLARARAAHAAAHARFSGEPRRPGQLKPVQRVLAALFEDARVEALALEHYPGLRSLWAPFHLAAPSHLAPLAALLARLSRALFDSGYRDPDAWIQKGRELFWAERSAWRSRELSQRLGSLMGNDLGQMRLSLDARQYVVEPIYRDDHSGLWVQAAVMTQQASSHDAASGGAAPPPQSSEHRYPEWDYSIATQRPNFCELSDTTAHNGSVSDQPALSSSLARRLQRCLRRRHLAPGWQRRCSDGPELDLAAAVDAAASARVAPATSSRIYRRPRSQRRASSTLLLLDLSESSNAPLASGLRSGELAQAAARLLCFVSSPSSGAYLAIHGFSSYGRRAVRYTRFKDFEDSAETGLRRLGSVPAAGSTRLGTALRHATAELRSRACPAKLLLVLTDGDPADIDVHDERYLVEDALDAVKAARRVGIRVFAWCMPGGPPRSRERVFGAWQGHLAELSTLPRLLARAYTALPSGGRRPRV
jgi:nitric oxide reductase NorD protein